MTSSDEGTNMGSFSIFQKEPRTSGTEETEANTMGLSSKEVFFFNHLDASKVSFSKQVKVEKNAGKYELNLPERLSRGEDGLVTSVRKRKSLKSLVVASGEELYKFSCNFVCFESSMETHPLQSC
jgi:hypothetical protein